MQRSNRVGNKRSSSAIVKRSSPSNNNNSNEFAVPHLPNKKPKKSSSSMATKLSDLPPPSILGYTHRIAIRTTFRKNPLCCFSCLHFCLSYVATASCTYAHRNAQDQKDETMTLSNDESSSAASSRSSSPDWRQCFQKRFHVEVAETKNVRLLRLFRLGCCRG